MTSLVRGTSCPKNWEGQDSYAGLGDQERVYTVKKVEAARESRGAGGNLEVPERVSKIEGEVGWAVEPYLEARIGPMQRGTATEAK